MNISTETIQWAMGIILAALGTVILRAYDKIDKMGNRILILESATPKPADLKNSLEGMGQRIGELESYRAVSKHLMDQIANNLQELHTMRKEDHETFSSIKDVLNEIKVGMKGLETKIDLHTERSQ